MAVDFEEVFAKTFISGCKRDNISTDYPELNNRKYRSNYEKIKEEILQSNPIEDNTNYKIISYNEVKYRAMVIVKYLLGDAMSSKEIEEALNLIEVTDNKSVMDGFCLDITDLRDGKRGFILMIPGMDKTISVVCLVGVILHYFEMKRNRTNYNNYRDSYVMSFLGEAICSHLLDREDPQNDMLSKLRGHRLDSIKFQINADLEVEKLIKQCPFIREDEKFKNAYLYESSRNYAFLMGLVDQICLLNRYLDDEKVLISKIRDIYRGDIKVPDMLDYYGIDIKQRETTEQVLEVVKKYK